MTTDDATMQAVRPYVSFFETLSLDTLPRLHGLAAPDVHFRDPLHEGHGIAAMDRAVRAMLTALDDPRFTIRTMASCGRTIFLAWTLVFRRRNRRSQWTIEGVSELHLDAQDRVAQHVNYWDAAGQLYEHVPLFGSVMRTIRRQVVSQFGGEM